MGKRRCYTEPEYCKNTKKLQIINPSVKTLNSHDTEGSGINAPSRRLEQKIIDANTRYVK